MKTNLKKIALLFCFVAFASCSSDDDNNNSTSNKTITEIAAGNANLSVLVSALQRTGLDATLDGTTQYTVFAPTNDKFNAFLQAKGFASLDAVPEAALKEILLNHVIAGEVRSTQLTTGYVKTLAKGSASSTNTLSMYVNTANGVVLNGGASNGGGTVVTADIDAKNGVIHIVDNVLDLPTIVNQAIANPNFSVLVQALTRNDQPNFAGILSGTDGAPFTVFAPTNDAFVSLLGELNLNGLADVPQSVLENTLKYHVVAGANVLSTTLTNNMSVQTFQGQSFTITLTGGAKITDASNRVSDIIATDVQASNGVIHVVNKVLLPSL